MTVTMTNSNATQNLTSPLRWISRDPAVVTVTPSGARTADVVAQTQASGTTTYVVATAGGWRTDSVLVTIQ